LLLCCCSAAAVPQTSTPAWSIPARTAQPAPPYAPTSPTHPPTAPRDAHAPTLPPLVSMRTTRPVVWTLTRAATTHADRTAQEVLRCVRTLAAAPTALRGARALARMVVYTATSLDAPSSVSEFWAGCVGSQQQQQRRLRQLLHSSMLRPYHRGSVMIQ
jgi:hypothetical protein